MDQELVFGKIKNVSDNYSLTKVIVSITVLKELKP